ncbi:related to chloride-bicarbonate anion exchanger AE2 [Rhynchosporium secalis]|uniref:Related to chloride-bicarbonate anion exchanger AE2 n=1 Tax=Rhynchosporium secalis TaxID=38038 RepID=A0A1E1MNC9_RHYSE|nr:related to chloride-bicarbonate anion exchanger AE2 [Rhynchosporium secalis]
MSSQPAERENGLRRPQIHTSTRSKHVPKWWKIRLFRGMINDVRRRAPYYWSDWVDAWDYRVVPATVYMYFANILPALAFSLDMFTKTNMSYGVNEVLLASVLGSVVFAVFAAQPLVIVGVTGPITVFNYTVYDIMVPTGTNYFAFMALIGLWSLVMHWILAITNSCNALKYVTRFSCDIFGFYVAFIYLQKGIQVLTRQGSNEPFYLSIMISLLVLVVGYICGIIGSSSLFQHYVRVFIKDYGTPLTVVFFTGFVHIGRMRDVDLETLPTSKAFFPTVDRGWFVHFWDISLGDVFIAIPFAVLLTILFYFDHNVSSLIAQGTEFPLRKPAGFHWDIFLLGLTTGVAGLLGIPFPNGLIPQAPFHTDSLCVTKVVSDDREEGSSKGHTKTIISHVVEQRFSNLAQGLLTLGTMTGPLLVVLHLIPQGVLAGLFFVMGVQALEGNGITLKILFLLKDKSQTPASEPLKRIQRRKAIWFFVAIQLFGFGATFAITQTIAAVGFPVVILLLVPVRTWLLPRYFEDGELRILDAPTASPFTMVSVGGNFGEAEADDSGHATAIQSGSQSDREGVLVGGKDADADSDEARAERGEGGSTVGVKRRESWRGEGRSGRWNELAAGDGFEMQDRRPGVNRRSGSRQSK